MIVYDQSISTTSTIGLLYGHSEPGRRAAAMLVTNMAEAVIDGILDGEPPEQTKEAIDRALATLREQAIDHLPDLMEDLRQNLLAHLRDLPISATVRKLDYSPGGDLEDIEVHLKFTPPAATITYAIGGAADLTTVA